MRQLFLSYAREDRAKVDDLVRNLPVLGYQVTAHGPSSNGHSSNSRTRGAVRGASLCWQSDASLEGHSDPPPMPA